jgi:hypothetical protein
MTEDRSINPTVPVTGVRRTWPDVPGRVKAEIERRVGSAVITTEPQSGGFSPGLASILRFADGSSLFVKGAGPEINPDTPGIYRREARIAPLLPISAHLPRIRWSLDEGDAGWIVLAFDVVIGRQPHIPWIGKELDLVIDAMGQLGSDLTPSPIPAEIIGRTDEHWGLHTIKRWPKVQSDFLDRADDWTRRNLERLIALEAASPAACAGETLLQVDMRADNILITNEGVVVVDWPQAKVGAAWIDAAAMAPSVALQNGPDPEDFLRRFPSANQASPESINAFVAMMAGYFTYQGMQPDPPGLPTVRAFQRAQGEIARGWIKQRTGWS